MEETKLVEHYTDSIYYELEKTARYCRFLGVQVFDKLGVDINPSEYATLDTISCNPGLCQRDLAKLILKDRANTAESSILWKKEATSTVLVMKRTTGSFAE